MDVAIAGGHGKVARKLARLLIGRGDRVRGLIRKPEHAEVLRRRHRAGCCDLETAGVEAVAAAIVSADAVVFAAGAGPGSGAGRKLTLDRDGAIKLLEAARAAGVERYVMISSIGAENPPDDDDVFSVYLRAKAEADRALMASDRRGRSSGPVFLTDDPGTRPRADGPGSGSRGGCAATTSPPSWQRCYTNRARRIDPLPQRGRRSDRGGAGGRGVRNRGVPPL